MTDFAGKTLGQYQVVEQIGKGGMATVYKGFQSSTNRYVAIKVLPPQFTHDDTFVQRFRQEAQVIAQLEHPSILPIYDFGQEEHTLYIVMRYVDGGTLHDLIKARKLTLPDTKRILIHVSSALDYAHEHNVIHRDLKPHNILVDRQGNAYLSDFGIAKLIEATMELTGTGVMGTPAYIAPEVAQGKKPDRRADVYSLGVVAYEMLTGRVPFEGETSMGVIYKHVNEPVPSTRSIVPNLSPLLDEVVRKALAKDPDQRYPSAGVFAQALGNAVDAIEQSEPGLLTMPLVAEGTPPPLKTSIEAGAESPALASKKRRPSTTLLVGGGAAGALAGCLCLFLVLSAQQKNGGCPGGPFLASPAPQAGDATSLALRLPDGQPLYLESFDAESSEWSYGGIASPTGVWRNGELCIKPDSQAAGGTATAALATQTLTNFVIDVDTTLVNNPKGSTGVLVRYQDDDNYLAFKIGPNAYAIQHRIDAQTEDIVPFTPSGAIRPPGETNHLRVEAVGSRFSLYINGAFVSSVTVQEVNPAGHIGFGMSGPSRTAGAAFDNLSVHSLEPLDIGQLGQTDLPIERDTYSWRFVDGQLVGELNEAETVVWFPANLDQTDVVIDVDTRSISSPADSAYGVLCRLVDADNFYEVLIDNSGQYSIWRLQNNEWTALADWSPAPAIHTGQNATNQLRVACVGNAIILAANGQIVELVEDDTFAGGDVALALESGTQTGLSVAFERYTVFVK